MNIRRTTVTFLLSGLAGGVLLAQDVTLTVDVAKPSHAVSPRLIGIFLEDINFGVDGGLNAELVKNGSFEFPDGLMGWSVVGDDASSTTVEIRADAPAFAANPHYLLVNSTTSGGKSGVENEGFRGMGVRAGERYHFSAAARTQSESPIGLRVTLVDENGEALATAELPAIDAAWSERSAKLTPSRTAAKARLRIALAEPGRVALDMVSLYPQNTWRNRPHGLRADLVEALANLKPAFFRFPGGCIVEGSRLADRYQWKLTIGDRPERRLNFNRWNTVFRHRPTPDYYQSQGIGFFEYFQLAEDIGAEPLPILHCGMACQFQSGELVPLEQLQPYVDDALDLVEFANGPPTSEWGAKRAAQGHAAPFGLKLLGVGNEQWGPEYFERYAIFDKALKEKHPEIELVAAAGPFPNDAHFHYAWPRLRALDADIVDEHCYAMPDWFLRSATRFDGYDRKGPKVFMGEYAAQSVDITSPDNRNNLRCALAEAAFLTGIERNSDVVVMSAYAPLLGHVDAWQWRPNLIWFDNLHVVLTPNYHVQQLFSLHRGDVVLPLELTDTRPPVSASGRIGLATDQASAEFKDIRVQRDGELLFSGDELHDTSDMTTFRGRWNVDGGTIRQANAGDTARAQFGNDAWRDGTISLKARKLGGAGGIGVIFRNSSGGSFLQWTIGGRDGQHRLEANLATHSEDRNIVQQVAGSIDTDRWYDVRIALRGVTVGCYLDDELVFEATIPDPQLPRVYAVASKDQESGQVILKVVNPASEPAHAVIALQGMERIAPGSAAIELSGHPEAENSLEHPTNVAPKTTDLSLADPTFPHTFPAYSLSIFRINAP